MRYVGIEILNNDVTPMEHVVALLEAAFLYDHDYAFDLMLKIHKGQRLLVAVFDGRFQAEIVTRFRSLNDRLVEPIQYVVIDDLAGKVPPFIEAEVVLATELPDFPPEEINWGRYVSTGALAIIVLTVALLLNYQRN